ncbi:MAG TPA: DUF2855 family protein [Actinomycetota bacterium]|nr:DUF2855 family protein [Actinomycetota bacterium]
MTPRQSAASTEVTNAWDLLVKRDELSQTTLVEVETPEPGRGEVLLQVDRVGMTANNVTYALAGDLLNYWSFFPAHDGWGRVPLWGFADVVRSETDDVPIGTRLYGYLPTSSHVVVKPTGVAAHGFKDGSDHRAGLDSAYNIYASTAGDPSYVSEHEDLQILYRPLFITSFMLDDFLTDNGFFGAAQIVTSSASSKTAYATAFCIARREPRPRLIALTSPRNVAFTRTLPYDNVVTYDDLESIPAGTPTLYLDLAGNHGVRARVHSHLGESLVYDCLVGVTHQESLDSDDDLPGPEPVFFFAPSQISKRRKDWGPGGIEQRYGEAWRAFVPVVADWVEVRQADGPEGLRAAWLEMLGGRSDPKTGLVISL